MRKNIREPKIYWVNKGTLEIHSKKRFNKEYFDKVIKLSELKNVEAHKFKTYKKILKHREKCKKWGKELCLECFGGGLNEFTDNIIKELVGR